MQARYQLIAHRLRGALVRRALRVGDRMISARALARREAVSLPTAVAALRVLEAEGLIVARARSGYFVCGAKPPAPERSTPPRHAQAISLAGLMRSIYGKSSPVTVPLGTAFPDPAYLPVREMQRALKVAARRIGGEAYAYSSPPGRAELRRHIALHADQWGARFGPDDLVITAGDTQAMRLALQVTCQRGDVVAVESPTYFGILLLLESFGLKALEIQTDPQRGLDVRHLATALETQKVSAVLACPTAQNPLGSSMSVAAKRELVKLLERSGVPLIEDDVYGDLVPSEPRSPACKAFDETGNVLYCSSVSKTLAPGWRIGWIAGGRFHERVLQARWEESLAGCPLFEAALADLMARGEYRRHLRRFRLRISATVRAVTARVEASFPAGTRISRPTAGFLLWIQLPEDMDALELHRRALERGISIAPGQLFSPQAHFTHHLRLSCASPVTPQLLRAVDSLGRLCRELRSTRSLVERTASQ